jgi:hypothetical protein
MEEQEIGGRKSHLPGNARSSDMNVTHVSGNGTNGGR